MPEAPVRTISLVDTKGLELLHAIQNSLQLHPDLWSCCWVILNTYPIQEPGQDALPFLQSLHVDTPCQARSGPKPTPLSISPSQLFKEPQSPPLGKWGSAATYQRIASDWVPAGGVPNAVCLARLLRPSACINTMILFPYDLCPQILVKTRRINTTERRLGPGRQSRRAKSRKKRRVFDNPITYCNNKDQ